MKILILCAETDCPFVSWLGLFVQPTVPCVRSEVPYALRVFDVAAWMARATLVPRRLTVIITRGTVVV